MKEEALAWMKRINNKRHTTQRLKSIGLIVFFTICVFKDAYFSYSETPVKNIVQSIFLFSLIGGINLYTGIMNQQEIISQHSPVKFNNINLISGILLLLADAIVITRAIMEHLQKEE